MTVTGSLLVSGSGTFTNIGPAVFSGSITSTAGFTGSFSGTATSASYADTASFVTLAQTASFVANAQSASNAVTAQTASFANTFTVASTLTAQTLVVQTITSSVDFVTGSTRFGSLSSNTHVFTGSLAITGGLAVNAGTTTVGVLTGSSALFSSIIGVNGASEDGWALKANGNLKVDSNSGTTVLQINDTSTSGRTWSLISAGTGNTHSVPAGTFYLRNSTDSITAFRITTTGNFGLNVQPAAWVSTAKAIQVNGFNSIASQHNGSMNLIQEAYENTSNSFAYGSTGGYPSRINMNPNDGSIRIYNAGTGTAGNTITWSERLTILNGGNVGIGTTNPGQLFAVRSGISGSLTAQESTVKFINTGSLYCKLTLSDNANYDGVISMENNATKANNKLRIYIGNATTELNDHITLTGTGNVGIGTSFGITSYFVSGQTGGVLQVATNISKDSTASSDSYPIAFFGSNDASNPLGLYVGMLTGTTTAAKKVKLQGTVIGLTPNDIVMQSDGGSVLIGTTSAPSAYGKVSIRGTNQGLTIQDAVSNGYRAIYFQSGNLYFYNGTNEGYLSSAGTWVNASDITLKKDVKEIEYGLNEIMQLKPKWYKMIEDDLEQIGFIAQDVEEVIPELVTTSQKGMKGLSYGQLTSVLTKAIQEQQSQIEQLQAEINELKNK